MIRRATLDDVPACARIVTDWERAQPYLPEPPAVEVIESLIAEAFPDREIWVTGNPVDGYMSVDPQVGKLGALYLTRRGEGEGRQMMDLAQTGRDSLWLTVYEPNSRAQSYYRREGFRFADRVPGSNPAPLGTAGVLKMTWRRAEAPA
jgi:putative acetyltransferase